MKKIFTLFAAIMVAMGMNAQEETVKYAVEEGFTPSDGQKVENTYITLEYGNDGSWKAATAVGETDPKFSEEDGFPFYVVGNGNPKSSNNKNFTPGNAATLPVTGTVYSFYAPDVSGSLEIAIKLNSNKSFYIADAESAMNLSADAVLTNTDGEVVTLNSSFQVGSAFTGFVKIDIKQYQTLMVFCAGSKLSFFGYRFTPGEVIEDTGTPHEPQAWNFTSKLSQTDIDNITADTENWEVIVTTDEETGEVKSTNYKHTPKFEGTAATANGVELELTKGLKFQTGAGKFEYYDGQRLAFGGNGHGPIIPECAKDDVVKIRYRVNDAARGFEAGNLELTDGLLIGDAKDTFEATMTVKYKGDATLSSVAGADMLGLAVNTDLPSAESDGILAVKNQSNTATLYNLAGQKVGTGFKGIAIMNGMKVVLK